MRITIELAEDVENRLRAVAEVEGVTPAKMVARLVSEVFGERVARKLAAAAPASGNGDQPLQAVCLPGDAPPKDGVAAPSIKRRATARRTRETAA